LKTSQKPPACATGWLAVLEECEHVAADFSADPFTTCACRCAAAAPWPTALMALDPDPDWKAMKKAGKRLFQRLGALRDVRS
jgi:hypothetical protein